MLLKLTPDQISLYWDSIKQTLAYNLPPLAEADEKGLTHIFEELLQDKMQAWAIHGRIDEKPGVMAIMITMPLIEAGTGIKNLLIYSFYGYARGVMSDTFLQGGLSILQEYAKDKGCQAIVAYSKVESLIHTVERLGGDTSWRFLRIPLEV